MIKARSAVLFALCVLAVAVVVAGCARSGGGGSAGGSTGGGAAAEPGTVVIKNFSFNPANTEVKAGTAVTWLNQDTTEHTVTADKGAFSSGSIDPGKSFKHTFDQPGTYAYHCSIHPAMVGQVVVK